MLLRFYERILFLHQEELRRAPADVLPGCRRRDVMVLLGDVTKTCQLNGVYIYNYVYIYYILSYYNVDHTIYINILYYIIYYGIMYIIRNYIYRLYEHID